MSRHTRQLLREYRARGLLDAPIPNRRVRDTVITMTTEERALYDQITEIVNRCYSDRDISQQSLGFIRTIFRKRLGSSTYAYAQTLRNAAERRLEDIDDWNVMLDDADMDENHEAAEGVLQKVKNVDFLLKAAEEAERLSHQDTKRSRLNQVIRDLREDGHSHVLMFTQFRDTQIWLSEYLRRAGTPRNGALWPGPCGGRQGRTPGSLPKGEPRHPPLHGNCIRVSEPPVLHSRSLL